MAPYKRGFSAPLALALFSGVSLVVVFGYLFSGGRQSLPNQFQNSAILKTYQNARYGFAVNYPDDWTFREFPDTKDGAGFRPVKSPDDPASESITVALRTRVSADVSMPFAEYVKVAAAREIQGFESLASIEKITTDSGLTGYKTTWNYRGPAGGPLKISWPITYFDAKDSKGDTVQFSLEDVKDEAVYDDMISTFEFSPAAGALSGNERVILGALIAGWPQFQKTIPARPVLGATKWNYPNTVEFLSPRNLLIEYDDGHISRYSIIREDSNGFIFVADAGENSLSAADWHSLQAGYGLNGYSPVMFEYTGSQGETVSASDWQVIRSQEQSTGAVSSDWTEYADASLDLSFYYPSDFKRQNVGAGFSALDDNGNEIGERHIGPYSGETEFNSLLLNDVIFDGSGLHPTSISQFKKVSIGGREFYKIRTERFEGVLSYGYYLPLGNKIAVFSFTARGVDWTNPNLDEESNPTHVILRQILTTIQT